MGAGRAKPRAEWATVTALHTKRTRGQKAPLPPQMKPAPSLRCPKVAFTLCIIVVLFLLVSQTSSRWNVPPETRTGPDKRRGCTIQGTCHTALHGRGSVTGSKASHSYILLQTHDWTSADANESIDTSDAGTRCDVITVYTEEHPDYSEITGVAAGPASAYYLPTLAFAKCRVPGVCNNMGLAGCP